MNYPIIIRPQAEKDIEKISRSPHLYPIVHKTIRRALARRFPYSIFYLQHENGIVVLAVFHEKRHPEEWQQRS